MIRIRVSTYYFFLYSRWLFQPSCPWCIPFTARYDDVYHAIQ